MAFMRAVRKIEARHVHARADKLRDASRCRKQGERTDNFCFSQYENPTLHPPHAPLQAGRIMEKEINLQLSF